MSLLRKSKVHRKKRVVNSTKATYSHTEPRVVSLSSTIASPLSGWYTLTSMTFVTLFIRQHQHVYG